MSRIHGLHSGQITGLMTCIAENKSYDDIEFVKRIIRAITDIHLDIWNETSLDEYIVQLTSVKEEIENMDKAILMEYKELLYDYNCPRDLIEKVERFCCSFNKISNMSDQ